MSGITLACVIRAASAPPSYYSWTRSAYSNDDSLNGLARITVTFNTNGSITLGGLAGDAVGGSWSPLTWHDGGVVTGIGNSRWAKKTYIGGNTTAGTILSTPTALSAALTVSLALAAGGATSGSVLIEIYSNSGGTVKVGEIILTLSANP